MDQQQILVNDLVSNGHKRNINTTDWQTIENINNRQQNLPRRYKQDNTYAWPGWLKDTGVTSERVFL